MKAITVLLFMAVVCHLSLQNQEHDYDKNYECAVMALFRKFTHVATHLVTAHGNGTDKSGKRITRRVHDTVGSQGKVVDIEMIQDSGDTQDGQPRRSDGEKRLQKKQNRVPPVH